MNIVLYESSSFGGCYEYCRYLFKAYKSVSGSVTLIVPSCSAISGQGVAKILPSDKVSFRIKIFRQLYFIYRQFVNPLILFFYLMRTQSSLVILNDFEQISAPLWGLLYRIFLSRHKFAVVLHDPDRDDYPPSRAISEFCMKSLIKAMHLGLYHEYLPDKNYYKGTNIKFLKVPHGLFEKAIPDPVLSEYICNNRDGRKLMLILGNIRKEKNYQLAIEALQNLKDWKLLIAGAPANSSVSLSELKEMAAEKGVSDQIIWIERFLSDAEMGAVIAAADLILLYYSKSFTSQSGILNLIAPYGKKVIVSDGLSSLAEVAKKFSIGILAAPDSTEALVESISGSAKTDGGDWKAYCEYASWSNHVGQVLNAVK